MDDDKTIEPRKQPALKPDRVIGAEPTEEEKKAEAFRKAIDEFTERFYANLNEQLLWGNSLWRSAYEAGKRAAAENTLTGQFYGTPPIEPDQIDIEVTVVIEGHRIRMAEYEQAFFYHAARPKPYREEDVDEEPVADAKQAAKAGGSPSVGGGQTPLPGRPLLPHGQADDPSEPSG